MFIYIECKISSGPFSGELAFRIENGIQHAGLAARRYFYTLEGRPIGVAEVSDGTPGLIMGRIIDDNDQGKLLVSIPDGEVIQVGADKVKPCEFLNVPLRPRPALGH